MSRGRKILTIFLILTLCFIWGQSLVPRAASQQESETVTGFLAPLFEFLFRIGNISDHFVRKLAHIAEFAVLGLEFSLYFKTGEHRIRTVMGHCFLTAFLDETIQVFSGRGPFISDVWIDIAGSAFGMAIILVISALKNRRKQNN